MKVINHGFDDEKLIAHACCDSKATHWILKMVENSEEHHDIELSNIVRRYIHGIYVKRLNFGFERFMSEIEAIFGTPTRSTPTEVVRRQYSLSACFFGLEREEAIPGPISRTVLLKSLEGRLVPICPLKNPNQALRFRHLMELSETT